MKELFVRPSTSAPSRYLFMGGVRWEFMQRLLAALHSILGSFIIREAFQGGACADDVPKNILILIFIKCMKKWRLPNLNSARI
jgi:hypothetical protein